MGPLLYLPPSLFRKYVNISAECPFAPVDLRVGSTSKLRSICDRPVIMLKVGLIIKEKLSIV